MENKQKNENTGWYSDTQARENGALIYVSARNGYPVCVTAIQIEKPNYEDVKKIGPVGLFLKKSKKYNPSIRTTGSNYWSDLGQQLGRIERVEVEVPNPYEVFLDPEVPRLVDM